MLRTLSISSLLRDVLPVTLSLLEIFVNCITALL
jgi:hypothetical protein